MCRIDGLSSRSKLDPFQRHKQVQTNTYPFIVKERENNPEKAGKL